VAKILNDDVDFSRVPEGVRRAFLGPATKTLFKTDATIYRVISIKDVENRDGTKTGNGLFESPWWISQETFRIITTRARRTGRSLRAVARSGLAVQREWNPHMDWMLIARMKDPAYGWVGRAKAQLEFRDDPQVWLIGGLPQIWLPGLAGGGNGTSSPYAFIDYCGAYDE
jgi:hypothetical protein